MVFPFKVVNDFQVSTGRIFVFNNNDPRVKTLNVDDIITTNNGCWKLLESVTSERFFRIRDNKAFFVRKIN